MSLMIKGINKVAFCIDCPCGHVDNSGVGYSNGKLMCYGQYQVPIYDKGTARHEIKECPITEIPTPHGRLIDADKLMKVIEENDYTLCSRLNTVDRGMFTIGIKQAIDELPTIIEAEQGDG